jgi:hypothetical protein
MSVALCLASWNLMAMPCGVLAGYGVTQDLNRLVKYIKANTETEDNEIYVNSVVPGEFRNLKYKVIRTNDRVVSGVYNAAVMIAFFTKLKKVGLRRINPFARDRKYFLGPEEALELLILDESPASFVSAALEAGAAAGIKNRRYINDIAPNVTNKILLNTFILALRFGFTDLYFLENICLKVSTDLQLRAFLAGFEAGMYDRHYYEQTALYVRNEYQLSRILQGLRMGIKDFNFYDAIANRFILN